MPTIDLESISSEEALLKCRIRDLPLKIEGTWLADCVAQLYQELREKGILFQPECYLADEWLTPEHEPVIGIPFYLAHPVLLRLEKKMMLEAEGETKDWCMKLLRHEAGHALCYAYRLNRKKRWKSIFGSSSQEYGETYRFRPYSKSYVRHLDGFYAQYHPDEDFVESFAVWLTPGLDWEKRYQGWKALKKLRYVNELMAALQGRTPLVLKGKKFWNLASLRISLKEFYKRKLQLRAEDFPEFHDGNLKKIFQEEASAKGACSAGKLIEIYGKIILQDVSLWTGEKKYVIHGLLKDISKRCQALKLFIRQDETLAVTQLAVYMTTLIMNYRYTGWYRGKIARRKEL